MPRRKLIQTQLDGIAGKLGAKVYNESPGFICLLDEDIHESVLGRGTSLAEAVNNWDRKLQSHLRNADASDPVVLFVKSLLVKASYTEPVGKIGKPTWTEDNKPQHVIDFENQFYSSKKRSN